MQNTVQSVLETYLKTLKLKAYKVAGHAYATSYSRSLQDATQRQKREVKIIHLTPTISFLKTNSRNLEALRRSGESGRDSKQKLNLVSPNVRSLETVELAFSCVG